MMLLSLQEVFLPKSSECRAEAVGEMSSARMAYYLGALVEMDWV